MVKVLPMWMIPNEVGIRIRVLFQGNFYLSIVEKDDDGIHFLATIHGEDLKNSLNCEWKDLEGWIHE